MGLIYSTVISRLFSQKEMRLLMLGLDAAGKTTILYKLRLGEVVSTIPTIGFNLESVEYHNIKFTVFDIGGQDKLRPLWRHYYTNTNGLIFVIDSNDRNRIDIACHELHRTLEHEELKDSFLLILANKQDLPNAMSTAEITEKLSLHTIHKHKWFLQSCCGITGDGIYEGLDWMASNLKKSSMK